jgi:hypothetical protein
MEPRGGPPVARRSSTPPPDIDLGPDDGEASGPQNLGATMNPAAFFMLGIIGTLLVVALVYAVVADD